MIQDMIYLKSSYGSVASRELRRLVAIGAPAFFQDSGRFAKLSSIHTAWAERHFARTFPIPGQKEKINSDE